MSGASEKPSSRTNLEASSFDPASASQVRLKDAYLGGLKEEQQGNQHISEESDDSESEPCYYKPVAQTSEACGEPLAGETAESTFQRFRKVKQNNLLYGSRLRHGQEDLRKTISRSYGRFGRECAHMGNIHECQSQSRVHLGSDHDVNLRHVNFSGRQKSWSVVRQRLLV